MPKRRCKVAHCREYVDIPEVYCEEHKGTTQRTYNKQVRHSPDNKKYADFYASTQWRNVRARKLSMNPMCEVCDTSIATIVHHRQEVRTTMGWEHRLDIDNLESICQECHNKEEHSASFRHRKG